MSSELSIWIMERSQNLERKVHANEYMLIQDKHVRKLFREGAGGGVSEVTGTHAFHFASPVTNTVNTGDKHGLTGDEYRSVSYNTAWFHEL